MNVDLIPTPKPSCQNTYFAEFYEAAQLWNFRPIKVRMEIKGPFFVKKGRSNGLSGNVQNFRASICQQLSWPDQLSTPTKRRTKKAGHYWQNKKCLPINKQHKPNASSLNLGNDEEPYRQGWTTFITRLTTSASTYCAGNPIFVKTDERVKYRWLSRRGI